ncbi:hypothetical protein ZEAMMB73_Zm00001d005287 [Zea mays]|uniref:Uncharacterized protein n=1 Tax=Zea mays TaxID=4577 RepID=A0A1D6ELJ7_MAIZE|nr:hypothetical protein ZEAMMB73_Zm00001d005287 [Zea mays]
MVLPHLCNIILSYSIVINKCLSMKQVRWCSTPTNYAITYRLFLWVFSHVLAYNISQQF